MHFTTPATLAVVAAAFTAITSGVSAKHGGIPSIDMDKRNLGSVLDERKIDTFFDEETHNTPRHARPIFQSGVALSSSHKNKKRHHSKRASGTCKKKASSSSSSSSTNDSDAQGQEKSSSSSATQEWTASALSSSSSSSASQAKSTGSSSSSSKTDTISPITSGSDSLGGVGLYSFTDSTCGKSGATEDVTKTTGPNGAMDWLNCGLDSGNGWNPPNVQIKDILVMSLDEALEEDNSPFKACQPYLSIFDKYAAEYDIPAILIASIAMQESTCNKDASGDNGGAHGLMQITSDKCTSGISCSDPDYNVKTGTKYLKDRLDANDGNILLALGQYNGWYKGLTVAKATAIKDSCCQCQNNINYHMQMLNGWLLNKNGYELGDWVMGC